MTLVTIIAFVLAVGLAIIIHEVSHGLMADRLGDPTPRLMGRLSLDPRVHYDRIGTTLLIITSVLAATGAPVIPFGWAKPVLFDPYNLKNPRRDAALISLAGPASNLILAVVLSIILRLISSPFSSLGILTIILYPAIVINVALAIFNLVPIHPLDGGKIFVGILPEKDALEADIFLKRYGTLILLFLIFPTVGGQSPISMVISPIVHFILNILIPGSSFI